MKRYKIVQHFTDQSDHMFRIYERRWLLFWEWKTSFTTIERCEHAIASWIEEEEVQRQAKLNTPDDRVIGYI